MPRGCAFFGERRTVGDDRPGHFGEDPPLEVDRLEERTVAEHHLRLAEKQHSHVGQGEVEPGQNAVPRPEFGRHGLEIAFAVARLPGLRQAFFIDISGVDLDAVAVTVWAQRLREQHRERVRLFPGGATGTPDSNGGSWLLIRDHLRYGAGPQILPCIGIAEEAGNIDQDGVEERGEFLAMYLEVVEVLTVASDTDLCHPPIHPAGQAGALVAGEVKAAAVLEVGQKCLEGLVGLLLLHVVPPPDGQRVTRINHPGAIARFAA